VPVLGLPWLSSSARRSIAVLSAAFVCFALLALIGANPQLDIQNTFIARVLFIPSFALLAIWIGLGLAILWGAIGPGSKDN
jgi:hypothetical protein